MFNTANGSLPNVATVSRRELGPVSIKPDGTVETQVFYTVGGNISLDPGNAGPIIL